MSLSKVFSPFFMVPSKNRSDGVLEYCSSLIVTPALHYSITPILFLQFLLHFAQQAHVGYIGVHNRALDLHCLPPLIDYELETSLRYAAIFAEHTPCGVVRRGRALAVDLHPIHHGLDGAVAVGPDEAIGPDHRLQHALDLIRRSLSFFRCVPKPVNGIL